MYLHIESSAISFSVQNPAGQYYDATRGVFVPGSVKISLTTSGNNLGYAYDLSLVDVFTQGVYKVTLFDNSGTQLDTFNFTYRRPYTLTEIATRVANINTGGQTLVAGLVHAEMQLNQISSK